MLIARFDNELFYSSSDESDRLSAVNNEISGAFPHLFWKVKESALVVEFKRQAGGVRDGDNISHYCFISCNQCIDILSLDPPAFSGLPDGI